ncbi:class I SAM-dependent DNA methyltransferase [Thermosediminibacter litoriperuensis]|uniref:Demethylmenaquinone methyltransferase/2-methoxy-6-polyprenyl-1,4-benzoquinol methylase n=1 Tax=Thermosediminibacter litoriperuensis TaxID=291989 RepID=A0A5S5AXE1_9FIRM|nr:class I SAM-dependent methyltransferase [Thermosediminibacter litoriperuensis]TYP58537.1 demethylmenaquinone methyltransferase/2-methoxy-6-polyprenyl-1,4-benzoquinol methylase [Thermosediminibacter litoriperuensis]
MPESLRRFFNDLAPEWDGKVNHSPEKIRFILKLTGIAPGFKILDVGCGTGVLIPYLIEKIGPSGEITGIDIAEKMLERAREKFQEALFPNVKFAHGDIMNFESPDKFDAIIFYSVFPHIEDKPKCIKKTASLLNPGGKLTICHSESREKINALHRSAGSPVFHHLLPPADAVASYMKQAGLEVIHSIDNDDVYAVIGSLPVSGKGIYS